MDDEKLYKLVVKVAELTMRKRV